MLMIKTDKWDSFIQAIDLFSDDFFEDGRSDDIQQDQWTKTGKLDRVALTICEGNERKHIRI